MAGLSDERRRAGRNVAGSSVVYRNSNAVRRARNSAEIDALGTR